MAQLLLVSSNLIIMFGVIQYSQRLHKIALKLEDYLMQYKWMLLTNYFIRVYADPNLTQEPKVA